MSDSIELLTTTQKARVINMNDRVYGTFAEIGAGEPRFADPGRFIESCRRPMSLHLVQSNLTNAVMRGPQGEVLR